MPTRIFQTRLRCGIVLAFSFLALVPLQRRIDQMMGSGARLEELLYVPSGSLLRRLSMGHHGLLADLYWTRVVQYYGRKRIEGATRFDLLGSLLRITTDLDPQLVIAYRFGAIFLAEKPPAGAGQPDEALHLLRRGIVANPHQWRLWQDVGFIYYWDLKDYPRAAQAFRVGSEQPGAYIWMKVLAASVAAEGGATANSRLLWSEIYREAGTEQIRKTAEEHLVSLQAKEDLEALNVQLKNFEQRHGRPAQTMRELVAAGYLRMLPRDPTGIPYEIGKKGVAMLGPGSRVDLQLLQ